MLQRNQKREKKCESVCMCGGRGRRRGEGEREENQTALERKREENRIQIFRAVDKQRRRKVRHKKENLEDIVAKLVKKKA